MKEKEKNPVAETAEQGMKSYAQALRAGLKFQEEAWQCWSNLLNESASTSEWQKYFAQAGAAVTGVLPTTRKRMEESVELMEQNSKAGAELVKKAIDAARAPTFEDSQSKWIEFWKGSVGLARTNAEAALTINSRAVDWWINLVQKNSEAAKAPSAKGV
jgi:hypothetical protein